MSRARHGAGTAAAYRGAFENVAIDFTFEFDDIVSNDNLAAVRTTGTGTMTVKATGQARPGRARELFVLKRVSDDWKISWLQLVDANEVEIAERGV